MPKCNTGHLFRQPGDHYGATRHWRLIEWTLSNIEQPFTGNYAALLMAENSISTFKIFHEIEGPL